MRNFFYFILIAAFFLASCEKTEKKQEEKPVSKKYKVVGYVAGWSGLDFSTIQADKLTHINYAFANIIDCEVRFGTDDTIDNASLNENDLIELQKLKKVNPDLKILVSVGGWTWSKNFSDVALTDSSRMKFAQSALTFILKYKLDGIDLDWEYPNQIGAGNTYRKEDTENFTLLLKQVRELLDIQSDKEARKGENRYLLTIATGADQAYHDNTQLGEIHKYLDFMNIMTYDFYNGLHKITGHHSNLKPSPIDPAVKAKNEDVRSVVTSVENHIKAGVPAEKIVLGVPFYGRMWHGVKESTDGLFQEAQTVGTIVDYKTLKNEYIGKKGLQKFYDTDCDALYMYSKDSAIFISYEDTMTLNKKLEYLKQKGLGGVMFWEYSNDYKGILLNSIDDFLNN